MLLVTTPTGQIGAKVLAGLLDAGEEVRVVARSAASLPSRVRDRVEVVVGSHADPSVLEAAYPGVRAVLQVVPPAPDTSDVEEHYRAFAAAASSAASRHGVQHVVAISTLGDRYGKPAGQLTAALAADALLQESGAGLRVLALPFFMENLLHQARAIRGTGRFALANDGDRELSMVATDDVARLAATLLLDPGWQGQERIGLVSPDRLTPVEAAGVLTDALHMLVSFEQISTDDYRASLIGYGSSPAWAEGLAQMVAAQNDRMYEYSTGAPRIGPTDLSTWAESTLLAAVDAGR